MPSVLMRWTAATSLRQMGRGTFELLSLLQAGAGLPVSVISMLAFQLSNSAMHNRETAIAGSVLMVCLCVMAVADRAPKIEENALTQARSALDNPAVQIRASGRDITLSGTVRTSEDKSAAGRLVSALPAIRKVQNRIFVHADTPRKTSMSTGPVSYDFSLSVSDANGRVDVFGNVPNDLSRQRIMTIVYTASIGREVEASRLRVAGIESGRADSWDRSARTALQSAVALDNLKFFIDAASLVVKGQAEDQAHRSTVMKELSVFGLRTNIEIGVSKTQLDLCQDQIDELLAEQPLEATYPSATLTANSRRVLDEIRDVLWQCPTNPIMLVSTSNESTAPDSHDALRQVVLDYLTQSGVVASRISAASKGKNSMTAQPDVDYSPYSEDAAILIQIEGATP